MIVVKRALRMLPNRMTMMIWVIGSCEMLITQRMQSQASVAPATTYRTSIQTSLMTRPVIPENPIVERDANTTMTAFAHVGILMSRRLPAMRSRMQTRQFENPGYAHHC
jgi:hypothetical protein